MNSDEENSALEHESSNEENMGLIFAENLEKLTNEQIEKRDQVKMQVADKLKKFQNKKIKKKKDFRILQGVLSKSFSRREQTYTEQLTIRKAEKDQQRRILT